MDILQGKLPNQMQSHTPACVECVLDSWTGMRVKRPEFNPIMAFTHKKCVTQSKYFYFKLKAIIIPTAAKHFILIFILMLSVTQIFLWAQGRKSHL